MTRRTRRRLSERGHSRRGVIAGVASGLVSGVALAGCLSSSSEDPPPIGIEEEDLEEIIAIEIPEVDEDLPVGIADDHVEAWEERVESLLEPIPGHLGAEIPNEAVRQYVDEEREEARERLKGVNADMTNYARLRPLRGARRHGAESEGAYAAAVEDRRREEVFEGIASIERRASEITSGLTRTGENPNHALVVYDAVEGRLHGLQSGHSPVDRLSPLASEVEAVGEASAWLETFSARVETVEHVLDRQAEVGDTTFDGRFERVAEKLLEDVEDRTSEVPSRSADPGELFDVPVEDTPRHQVGRELLRMIYGSRNYARDQLEDGWIAVSLVALYGLEHELRTLESIRERIEGGELDRPDGVDEVREAKRTAIAEAETVREGSEYPHLTRRRLGAVLGAVGMGDWELENGRHDPDRAAVRALGHYGLGAEFARTLPETTEWLVDALDGR